VVHLYGMPLLILGQIVAMPTHTQYLPYWLKIGQAILR
jgi:hypothetical protein